MKNTTSVDTNYPISNFKCEDCDSLVCYYSFFLYGDGEPSVEAEGVNCPFCRYKTSKTFYKESFIDFNISELDEDDV